MTNENLLYSTGNSTRCSVMEKEREGWEGKPKKEGIYIYMYVCMCIDDSHCYTAETNTTL